MAFTALKNDYEEQGKGDLFAQLNPMITTDSPEISYGEIATSLDLKEGAVRTAVHRLRRRYSDCLRAEVSQTVSTEEEMESEMSLLLGAFN